MFKQIVVPLDGSSQAEIALVPASELARRFDAEILLVSVPAEAGVEKTGAYLTDQVQRLSKEQLRVHAVLPPGTPAEAVRQEAALVHADLIVMATHGRTGLDALLHPSVTWNIFTQTTAPILTCRSCEARQATPQMLGLRFLTDKTAPILVPLDGSAQAEEALALACKLSEDFGNPLVLARAAEPLVLDGGIGAAGMAAGEAAMWAQEDADEYLHAQQENLIQRGLTVQCVSAVGPPINLIRAVVQEYQVGLIVIASHGRGWLGRLVLGSVARTILSHIETPVLLVRRAASHEKTQPAKHPMEHKTIA
jgi:nucleotide-binding universal stress UspA family protein